MSDPRTTLEVPRAFANYACERSMVCCHAPIVAPVDDAEEAALRAALDATEAGRALVPSLADAFHDHPLGPEPGAGTLRGWRHGVGGACRFLLTQGAGPSCAIHATAGLAALPIACRNFPRLVVQNGDSIEVNFDLSCPTAARLLAEDPGPYALVTRPAEDYPYPAARTSALAVDPRLVALRDAWWALLSEVRTDPERLVAALGALILTPLVPPRAHELPALAALEAVIGAAIPTGPANHLANWLEHGRARGALYQRARDTLVAGLTRAWSTRELVIAAQATPEQIAVFAEYGIGRITLREAAAPVTLVLAARRALAVLRTVELLCDRVPLRTTTLFADAYQAAAQIDPAA